MENNKWTTPFGEWIKTYLYEEKISLDQFSEDLGVEFSHLLGILSGRIALTDDFVYQFSKLNSSLFHDDDGNGLQQSIHDTFCAQIKRLVLAVRPDAFLYTHKVEGNGGFPHFLDGDTCYRVRYSEPSHKYLDSLCEIDCAGGSNECEAWQNALDGLRSEGSL